MITSSRGAATDSVFGRSRAKVGFADRDEEDGTAEEQRSTNSLFITEQPNSTASSASLSYTSSSASSSANHKAPSRPLIEVLGDGDVDIEKAELEDLSDTRTNHQKVPTGPPSEEPLRLREPVDDAGRSEAILKSLGDITALDRHYEKHGVRSASNGLEEETEPAEESKGPMHDFNPNPYGLEGRPVVKETESGGLVLPGGRVIDAATRQRIMEAAATVGSTIDRQPIGPAWRPNTYINTSSPDNRTIEDNSESRLEELDWIASL